MTKKQYQKDFSLYLKKGYWCDEIAELNTKCIRLKGYSIYKKWENEILRKC